MRGRFAVLSVVACLTVGAAAQERPVVQLRSFGHSYFLLITTAGTRVAFDPHAISEYGPPMIAPDIVCMSHNHDDHNRKEVLANAESRELKAFAGVIGTGKKSDWAKIDEKVKDVRVRNVPTYHDEEEGAKRGKNSVFVVEADGLVFCHLGDLGHELTDDQVRAIGPVDVLMVPVGGIYTINGEKAKKVVSQLKPRRYIIPMHYGTKVYPDLLGPEEFLDGERNVIRLEDRTNLLEITPETKESRPRIVVLGWK